MGDAALTEAYHAAVDALCRFRDAHLPVHRQSARRVAERLRGSCPCSHRKLQRQRQLNGHAAWDDLVRFLKEVRE